jgi:hypothetical protein
LATFDNASDFEKTKVTSDFSDAKNRKVKKREVPYSTLEGRFGVIFFNDCK